MDGLKGRVERNVTDAYMPKMPGLPVLRPGVLEEFDDKQTNRIML